MCLYDRDAPQSLFDPVLLYLWEGYFEEFCHISEEQEQKWEIAKHNKPKNIQKTNRQGIPLRSQQDAAIQ